MAERIQKWIPPPKARTRPKEEIIPKFNLIQGDEAANRMKQKKQKKTKRPTTILEQDLLLSSDEDGEQDPCTAITNSEEDTDEN